MSLIGSATTREAEGKLRAAIRERVRLAEEHGPAGDCQEADAAVELAIGGLILAAVAIGRPRDLNS